MGGDHHHDYVYNNNIIILMVSVIRMVGTVPMSFFLVPSFPLYMHGELSVILSVMVHWQ